MLKGQPYNQGLTQEFFSLMKNAQQIQLRIEGRENVDLGAVAPSSGVWLNLQMIETHILISLSRMYFSRTWEFGSDLSKLWNFGGSFEPPNHSLRYDTAYNHRLL
jgi:hypothetical protein